MIKKYLWKFRNICVIIYKETKGGYIREKNSDR